MVELGKSKLTTVLTPRKSMPRPIRSVATSTQVRPSLQADGQGMGEKERSRLGKGCSRFQTGPGTLQEAI